MANAAATSRRAFRMTRPGYVYLGVLTFVVVAAFNSSAPLLYFAVGIMAGALLASVFLPALCLRKLEFSRTIAAHSVAGEPTEIEYRITNQKWIWSCFAIQFVEVCADLQAAPRGFVLHIPRRKTVALTTRLIPGRRGAIALSEIEVSCAFPFGFITRTRRLRFPQQFVVYPRIGMLNRQLALRYRESIESGTMTSSVRGGSDEFYGVREYRAGDNVRAIHWRSTARKGQLMIREMAANAPPQMIVVLNLRAWRREDQNAAEARARAHDAVERAIEMAAALLCYGFFENFAVGLAIAGVDTVFPPSPQMGREARALMLQRLAVLDAEQVRADEGIAYPNRLAGRAEWIIVTLHGDDPCRDLIPPSSGAAGLSVRTGPGSRAGGGGNTGGGGHQTILPMDARDSKSWLRFLSGDEALRLLRDPGAPPPPPPPPPAKAEPVKG